MPSLFINQVSDAGGPLYVWDDVVTHQAGRDGG